MSTTHPPRAAHLRRPHLNPWRVAVVALAAAVVALSGWILIDSEPSPPQGLASDEVAAMLAARIAAFDSGRAEVSRFYAPAAILEERDVDPAVVTEGRAQIGARIEGIAGVLDLAGLKLRSESTAIQFGRYAAEAASIGEDWDGILVYKLDEDGRIVHQWVIGP